MWGRALVWHLNRPSPPRLRILAAIAGALVGLVSSGPTPTAAVASAGTVPQHARLEPSASADTPARYARGGYRPRALPATAWPYRDIPPAPRIDPNPHDAAGVRMFAWQGTVHNHPVAQAQWGLSNLRAYLGNRDLFFLDRAIAQAQRNLDRKTVSRGAWWYPYEFGFSRCAGVPDLHAPWYSAMAQGQLLSLFVWLHEITRAQRWREAADLTFASLTLQARAGTPWATWVDPAGYLWLEEYPETPGVRGERVLNGHVFAIYGVYDYWRLTADPRAVEVFDGATTTLGAYVPTTFRVPEWASRYSIGCPQSVTSYQRVHTSQLLKLYELTGATDFARFADLFRADYPTPEVSGTVRFSPGAHLGYRFDSRGSIVEQKPLTLSRASTARADQRVRMLGRGVYYRIVNGALAGFHVPETPGRASLVGKAVEHGYLPERSLTFQPGTYTAYRYDSGWNVAACLRVVFYRPSAAPFGSTAWVNGQLGYRMTAGIYAGFWLPAAGGLVPAPGPGATGTATDRVDRPTGAGDLRVLPVNYPDCPLRVRVASVPRAAVGD